MLFRSVRASDVVRVVRGLPCQPIPGSRPHLLGLAQYGGEPLPVLDLHALVEGGQSAARRRSTVILSRGERRDRSVVGLAVDEVLQVVDLGEEADLDSGEGFVGATVEAAGQSIKILNAGRLLADESDDTGAMNG